MNWDVISHWWEAKVFPSIAATDIKSVVVIDRDNHLTVLDEQYKRLATSRKKLWLIEAIKRWRALQMVGL